MGRKPTKTPKFRITNLRAWREHRNLSQEALAERVDSTAATISRLETGQVAYTQQMLEQLADALRCEPADLIMRLPPGSEEHRLWSTVQGMKAEDREFVTAFDSLTEEERETFRRTMRMIRKAGS